MSRVRTAGMLAALAAGLCALPAASAQAQTSASVHASLLPDRSGAAAALKLTLVLAGGEEGVPAPLSGMLLALPAGLGIDLRDVPSCAASRLRSAGAGGCPRASLLGRGHSEVQTHAGSQTIPEEAAISVFRGSSRGSRPSFEILSQGETPLDERTVSTAVLTPDDAPYGWKLTVAVAPIPTLELEPNASITSLSFTIGGAGHGAKITVPRRCPSGGFPFAASFTFADGSSAKALATAACP